MIFHMSQRCLKLKEKTNIFFIDFFILFYYYIGEKTSIYLANFVINFLIVTC